jgi:hypothetical protein
VTAHSICNDVTASRATGQLSPVTAITRNCGMLYLLSAGPLFQLLDRLQQPRPLLLSVIERATMLEG